tara:strand:- start:6978 stop:7229 length:252 start_codon:yes stop_codon:yes gene_type:complete
MDINPKQFLNSKPKDNSTFVSIKDEIGRDDDDPLSIRDASQTILGIILAIFTVMLPAMGVLLERPMFQKSGIIYNQMVKENGY